MKSKALIEKGQFSYLAEFTLEGVQLLCTRYIYRGGAQGLNGGGDFTGLTVGLKFALG